MLWLLDVVWRGGGEDVGRCVFVCEKKRRFRFALLLPLLCLEITPRYIPTAGVSSLFFVHFSK